jgi:hypothetical protein
LVSDAIAELRITVSINILTGNITIEYFINILMYYIKFIYFHDNTAMQAATTSHTR